MQDANGFTPLHLSIISKSSRIALKLLQNGADTSLKDSNGRTPLEFAINKGEDNIKDILEESKKCQLFRMRVPLRQIKRNYKNLLIKLEKKKYKMIIEAIKTWHEAYKEENIFELLSTHNESLAM